MTTDASMKVGEKLEPQAFFDYSDHNLIDVIDDDWSRTYIDEKVIIYKNKIYPITNESIEGKYKPKTFTFHKKSNTCKKEKEEIDYNSVANVNKIAASLAIGTMIKTFPTSATKSSKIKSSYFVIMPAAASRKIQLVPSDQSEHIQTKTFVTNYHVLLQFKANKIPLKNGGVVDICTVEKQEQNRKN